MKFFADLHIHSKHSRACSRDCDLEHLSWWGARKGIRVVGTGDFTHPGWSEELRQRLVAAEPGLFRLRPELETEILDRLPPVCRTPVRFMLTTEISTIYKRDGRTRKVHHLLYAPSLEAAAEITKRLARIGNLASDGRPILGLDSRDLLEITLESGPDCFLIPAHVWTPWFAALGSQSGFDAIDECYGDLADQIFAVETGLSSDPEMNWRISALDRFRLVSNSDAHSPPMLGREATWFDTEPDYFSIQSALRSGIGFGGTVEFFPEEGKYHLDGHRSCDVRTEPNETRKHHGRCPACGKPLTVGVLHRVETLADRPEGHRPAHAGEFRSLIPLPEIIGELCGVGARSKTVAERVSTLVGRLGPELSILDEVPLDEIAAAGGSSLLGEALGRLRRGEVRREAGYDGVYGTIRLFAPGELLPSASTRLFDVPIPEPVAAPAPQGPHAPQAKNTGRLVTDQPPASPPLSPTLRQDRLPDTEPVDSILGGLDAEQRAVLDAPTGPLLIVAGPGTGKTRVLTRLLAHRVRTRDVPPAGCLAVTFTRRAAEELRSRLADLLGEEAEAMLVATFHGLGLRIIREHHAILGLPSDVGVAGEGTRLGAVGELQAGRAGEVRQLAAAIAEAKRRRAAESPAVSSPTEAPLPTLEFASIVDAYDASLRERGLVDLDDLIALPVSLLAGDPQLAERYRRRWPEIAVDEFQDIDELQYQFLRLLAGTAGNLTVIGDPDQAIYGFRGGDVGYFLRFSEEFPGAHRVQLVRNHRSAPTIVRAAVQVIRPSTLAPGRRLLAAREDLAAERIIVHHAGDEQEEAEVVAAAIDELLGGTSWLELDRPGVERSVRHQLSFSDFAVLFRTASQAEPVLEALARHGFPAQARSHERLGDRPAVQAIVRELEDRPVAEASVSAMVQAAAEGLLAEADRAGQGSEGAGILEAVELLGPLAGACGSDLARFLTELAVGVEVDLWDPRADRVSLLTLHAAKGLEFPVVFIVGCEDGMLPFRRGAVRATPDELAEERRLFFVGLTRATHRLILTSAGKRRRWGTLHAFPPSPFVSDLDPGLLDRRQGPAGRRGRGALAPHRQLRLL